MIYSQPYPFDGTDQCPSTNDAQQVVNAAFSVDGRAVIEKVKGLETIKWDEHMPTLPPGVGIAKLRKPIADLWERMSQEAKLFYLRAQWNAAVAYLQACADNLTTAANPDVPTLTFQMSELPTGEQAIKTLRPDYKPTLHPDFINSLVTRQIRAGRVPAQKG